jgi:hypothetical protein
MGIDNSTGVVGAVEADTRFELSNIRHSSIALEWRAVATRIPQMSTGVREDTGLVSCRHEQWVPISGCCLKVQRFLKLEELKRSCTAAGNVWIRHLPKRVSELSGGRFIMRYSIFTLPFLQSNWAMHSNSGVADHVQHRGEPGFVAVHDGAGDGQSEGLWVGLVGFASDRPLATGELAVVD